ncbi:uncharacterized protein A4U43_C05F6150 [Asparagus officinalis]|uniref:Uncharacterized protein n=1 Tax=Asparagus officinalis TaxID=4686 RepID=A0A5P1EV57_ASPOF|nr:uncharacterized protein A4U43_C05F6150 [Asparagus officinalis]
MDWRVASFKGHRANSKEDNLSWDEQSAPKRSCDDEIIEELEATRNVDTRDEGENTSPISEDDASLVREVLAQAKEVER